MDSDKYPYYAALAELESPSKFSAFANQNVQWCADEMSKRIEQTFLNLNVQLTKTEKNALQYVISNIFNDHQEKCKRIRSTIELSIYKKGGHSE